MTASPKEISLTNAELAEARNLPGFGPILDAFEYLVFEYGFRLIYVSGLDASLDYRDGSEITYAGDSFRIRVYDDGVTICGCGPRRAHGMLMEEPCLRLEELLDPAALAEFHRECGEWLSPFPKVPAVFLKKHAMPMLEGDAPEFYRKLELKFT